MPLTFPRLLELETSILPISSIVVPQSLDSKESLLLSEELGDGGA